MRIDVEEIIIGGTNMGATYTEAQRSASRKYMSDKHTLRVIVTKEKAEYYKEIAKEKGMSLNKFIIESIEKNI